MKHKIEEIDLIVVHCSDTPPTFNGGAGIDYHFVVKKSGEIENGRPIDTIGAHTKWKNRNSIGICWIGGANELDDRTDAQKNSLDFLVQALSEILPSKTLRVTGHSEFSDKKCPNYNAGEEYSYVKR